MRIIVEFEGSAQDLNDLETFMHSKGMTDVRAVRTKEDCATQSIVDDWTAASKDLNEFIQQARKLVN